VHQLDIAPEQVDQLRERLEKELRNQGEQIQKLMESAQSLAKQHGRLEQSTREQFDSLATGQLPASGARLSFERLLSSVRNLITATDAEQVFESLTEEAEQMGVRAAVFDIRGRAAWGFSARGFAPDVTRKLLHALVVPLNQENPFRKVYETGGHVDLTVNDLRRNRNIVSAFKPSLDSPILLQPIRSAGSVTAIFYCDPKDGGVQLPVDALKILTEFGGAQLDRLMALAGEMAVRPEPVAPEEEIVEAEEPAAEASEAAEPAGEAQEAEPASEPEPVEAGGAELAGTGLEASAEAPVAEPVRSEPAPQPESELAAEAAVEASPATAAVETAPATAAAPSLDHLSEAEQKIHKDAKRFAKLLVSEIELYNKAKVAEARKKKDLYHRLKSDIDRSRQTYDKRFGSTLGKQHDYFHEELVRLLAENEPSLLGADYPGPSA
jgi:hypothetical protein